MIRNSFLAPLVVTILLSTCDLLCAQALVLSDCQGFTRAVQQVRPGSLNNIEVAVTDAAGNPATGIEVNLTNSVTGEVTTAISNNGVAVFEGVTEGAFSVSTSASNVAVGSVSVGSAGVGTAVAGAAVGGTAVAGGGTIVAVSKEVDDQLGGDSSKSEGSEDSGSGSNDSGSGSEEGTGTDTDDPSSSEEPDSSQGSGSDSEEEDCNICDPDATPPGLDEDDFFDEPDGPGDLSPFS